VKYLAILFSLVSFDVVACSCRGYDIEDAFDHYPIVFAGTVEKIDVVRTKMEGWFNYSEHNAVTLVVEKDYKGVFAEIVLVTTSIEPSACGFPFKQGVKYVVFAYASEMGLSVGSCSPTIHMEKGAEPYENERLYVTKFLSQKHGT
jgi:hypothetical protein